MNIHAETFAAHVGPILIQTRDESGEWVDYGRCDAEKAGRFLGWGDNANWYRALDAATREPISASKPVYGIAPREWRIIAHADGTGVLEIRIGNMSEEELTALIAVLNAFRYSPGL